MNITKAELKSGSKGSQGGLFIQFDSKELVTLNNYFKVKVGEKSHNFQTVSVETLELKNKLRVIAREEGYWASKLDRTDNLDLRDLIDLPVEAIADQDEIKKIERAKTLC